MKREIRTDSNEQQTAAAAKQQTAKYNKFMFHMPQNSFKKIWELSIVPLNRFQRSQTLMVSSLIALTGNTGNQSDLLQMTPFRDEAKKSEDFHVTDGLQTVWC